MGKNVFGLNIIVKLFSFKLLETEHEFFDFETSKIWTLGGSKINEKLNFVFSK